MIPHKNIRNLMLDQEVVDAVAEGKFHIWPVTTVEEGLKILTGMDAGTLQEDGTYPEGTIYRKVDDRLKEISEIVRKFGKELEDGGKKSEEDEGPSCPHRTLENCFRGPIGLSDVSRAAAAAHLALMASVLESLIWIIDNNHWERANIRAVLIERGCEVEGFVSIFHAVVMLYREIVEKPAAIVLEIKNLPYQARNWMNLPVSERLSSC